MDAKHHDMSALSLIVTSLLGQMAGGVFHEREGCVCVMNGAGLVYWVQAALMAFTQVTHQ